MSGGPSSIAFAHGHHGPLSRHATGDLTCGTDRLDACEKYRCSLSPIVFSKTRTSFQQCHSVVTWRSLPLLLSRNCYQRRLRCRRAVLDVWVIPVIVIVCFRYSFIYDVAAVVIGSLEPVGYRLWYRASRTYPALL